MKKTEVTFEGKKIERKLAKDWWWKEFYGENNAFPADKEYRKFGEAVGATPETEILCISTDWFSWPPSAGFSEEEVNVFSRQNPTTLVSVLGEETEWVFLNGRQIGEITTCRSSIDWKAKGIYGRNW